MRKEKLKWAIDYRLKKLQPDIERELDFESGHPSLDNLAILYIGGYAELMIYDCGSPVPGLEAIDAVPLNRPEIGAQSFQSLFDFELFLDEFLACYWRE